MDLSKPIHDTTGISGTTKDRLLFWLVLAPIALLFFHWIISTSIEVQADKNAFMAKCIEFNHPDRCLELDRWGRRDLFDRKDFR